MLLLHLWNLPFALLLIIFLPIYHIWNATCFERFYYSFCTNKFSRLYPIHPKVEHITSPCEHCLFFFFLFTTHLFHSKWILFLKCFLSWNPEIEEQRLIIVELLQLQYCFIADVSLHFLLIESWTCPNQTFSFILAEKHILNTQLYSSFTYLTVFMNIDKNTWKDFYCWHDFSLK